MRREIRCLRDWRRKLEKPREGCGLIHSRCRRGNGGREPVRTSGKSVCYTTVLRPQLTFRASPACPQCSNTFVMVESGEVDFSRALTYPSACSKMKCF